MHGGAKTLHPAMHGGGVDPATWRCMAEVADLDPVMIAGGLGRPRHGSWRVRTQQCNAHEVESWTCLVAKNFGKIDTVVLSFVFEKYYPIMD